MALASFAETSFKGALLVCHLFFHLTAARLGTARLAPAGCIANPAAGVQNGRASPGRKERALRALSAALAGGLSTAAGPPRSPPCGLDPGDRHVRPKRALLRLVEPFGDQLRSSSRCSGAAAGEIAGRAKRRARRSEGLATGSSSRSVGAAAPSPRTISPSLRDLPLGQIAEEGKRDVQRLGRHHPQRRVAQLALAPADDPLAQAPPAGPGPRTGAPAGSSISPCSPGPRYGPRTHGTTPACDEFASLRPTAAPLRPAAGGEAGACRPGRRAFADVGAAARDHRVAGERRCRRRAGRGSRRSRPASPRVPPSGPAMPVIETATSAPKRSSAPSAIASATSSETAPFASISAGSTPSSSALASFE